MKSICVFYADDGYLGGIDYNEVQTLTDMAADKFKTLGLVVNTLKMKVGHGKLHIYIQDST